MLRYCLTAAFTNIKIETQCSEFSDLGIGDNTNSTKSKYILFLKCTKFAVGPKF